MRKIVLIFILILLLAGCGNKDKDPYAAYRHDTATKIFNGGEEALADGHYSTAVEHFEALDAIYPFGPYAQQGQLDVIYAYYKNGDDGSALAAADRYIRLYPRGKNVDYAYYMRGIVGFTAGMSWLQKMAGSDPAPRDMSTMRQSFSSFATLVHDFPHSKYTPDALIRMAFIRNAMARRELLVAQFYFEHHAFVAAANRASYVVQHFEGSPKVADALVLMIKSYQALGLSQMASATYKILEASYPDSNKLRQFRST